MSNKIYRKSAGHWINFKSSKSFQYLKASPQDQQKGQHGQMFWWVHSQRHMAYTQPRTASVFRLLATKTAAIKAWEKVCTKILCEEARTHFRFSCCIYSFQCLWACTCCWGQTRRKRRQCQTPGHNYSSNRVTLQHHSKQTVYSNVSANHLPGCHHQALSIWKVCPALGTASSDWIMSLKIGHSCKVMNSPPSDSSKI